ncbi:SPOR domain-containing protein [Oceanisphaera pacifica]|uniref:SPOR domain-containing protein n=1 Tax=Oceanisphaera pacifica TaxID=2818389 RepID=A0ABS3NI46_9GAMM|nr:SPOR domain-containing protein [Oceanisphaera pacifica]MBO1520264.1 SPOR domain-containing protein [Oceanisphaera pacifica]
MATQFQHRLVGTVILVALGVIFLPDVLNGKQQRPPDEAVTIPLRPNLEPVRPVAKAPAASAQDQAVAQATEEPQSWSIEQAKEAPPVAPTAAAPKTEPKPAAKPKPAPKPVPNTVAKVAPVKPVAPATTQAGDHIVQLGAFRNAANVNALVKKLQAAGYSVHTTPAVPREGDINRVWIGPDNKARLERQLGALEQLTGLKGSVRPK